MPRAFLQVLSGPRQGTSIPLDADVVLVVGRKRAELLIDDPLVSGRHCQFSWREGKVVLKDLGSTNGTMVNGARIERQPLKPGDQIQMGRLVLGVTLP